MRPRNIGSVAAQEVYRFDISVKALAGNCFRAVVRDIGDLAESLTLVDFGDVDFYRRDLHSLESIEKRDGSVGVSARINYDSVGLIKICLLNIVDQITFVIALEALYFNAFALTVRSDQIYEVIVSRSTVDIGLPDAEHIEVWSVKNEYLHNLFQLSQDIGDSLVVEILLDFESVIGDLVVAPGLILILALLIELLDSVEL